MSTIRKDPTAVLLKDIEKFLAKTGMRPSRFGRLVANNSTLVPRLRRGKAEMGTFRKVWKFIEEYKP